MEVDIQSEMLRDGVVFYSVLYSTVTVIFAMAILSKFFTNEFRFGFRSCLSLILLFLGEPLCQFLVTGPSGLAVFSLGCLIIYFLLPASHLPAFDKSVLITGCDSGFGHALAIKLDSLGLQVFAGCLDNLGDGAQLLKHKCSDKLHILKLDVTDTGDVEAAASYIKIHTQEKGLWGVVNNAGVWYVSELEMTSENILQRVLEVNLLGAVRTTKAVLPMIRKARGRIVNVCSLMGRVCIEGNGAYCMSKHALVAYSNTLRLEMKKWGVSVSIVEPSAYCTGNMHEDSLRKKKEEVWSSLDEETKQVYGRDYLDSSYAHIQSAVQGFPKDVTPVVRCIRSGLLSKRPLARYPCGLGADLLGSLHPLLPIGVADYVSSCVGLLPRHLWPQSLHPAK